MEIGIFTAGSVRQELCTLPVGHWYIAMSPKVAWDFLYLLLASPDMCDDPTCCGDRTCDVIFRDGEDDNPCRDGASGFGYPDWTPFAELSGYPAASSYTVEVQPAPSAPRCVYRVAQVLPLTNLNGDLCDVCDRQPGDFTCAIRCTEVGQCSDRLMGMAACGNGGACKVKAKLVGCDACPDGGEFCLCQ